MQGLGFLLSAMPDEEIPEKLFSLLSPHIQDLERLANQTVRIVEFPLILKEIKIKSIFCDSSVLFVFLLTKKAYIEIAAC